MPLLHEVGVHPAHTVMGGRQDKDLWRRRFSLLCLLKHLPLLSVQQFRDRLLEGAAIVHPHEVDGAAALLRLMVEPLAAADGDAAVRSQSFLPARGQQPLSPAEQVVL